jgi:hypothetical protein
LLRIGVILESNILPDWQAQCIKALDKVENVQVALLIITEFSSSPKSSFLKYTPFGDGLWQRYFSRKVIQRSQSLHPVAMSDIFSSLTTITCRTTLEKGKETFSKTDSLKIAEHNLDILLYLGNSEPIGDILNASKSGFWKYQLGKAPGFWEIYKSHPVTEFSLTNLQNGATLRRVALPTVKYAYHHQLDTILSLSAKLAAQECNSQINGGRVYSQSSAPTISSASPQNWQIPIFWLKLNLNRVTKIYNDLFKAERWNVGVVDAPIEIFLQDTLPQPQWLEAPAPGCFMADPFGLQENGHTTFMAEGYDYRTRKGWIATFERNGSNIFSKPETVIELPVHLSYPYLIKYQGEIYCAPETYQNHEVALYRANPFPKTWEKAHTLINNFNAVDTTIFQHEGRWWLLCTAQDGANGDSTTLFAFYAQDLMGDWLPHAANPIKVDVRSSRPAGTTFVHEGQLYRPAQDCSRTYGGAVAINKVVKLSPTEFYEETVKFVTPYANSPYPHGLHTISSVGNLTVIDAKKMVFIPQAFRQALKDKLGRHANKLPLINRFL